MISNTLKFIFKNDSFFAKWLFFSVSKKEELQEYDLNISIYNKKAKKRLRLLIIHLITQALTNKGKDTRRKIGLRKWLLSEKNRGRSINMFEIDCAVPKDSCLLISFSVLSVFRIHSDREDILYKKLRIINKKKTASAFANLNIELKDIEVYLVGKSFSLFTLMK